MPVLLAALSSLAVVDSLIVVALPGWTTKGCYTNATNAQALSDTSYSYSLMTVKKCAAVAFGYSWFGVQGQNVGQSALAISALLY